MNNIGKKISKVLSLFTLLLIIFTFPYIIESVKFSKEIKGITKSGNLIKIIKGKKIEDFSKYNIKTLCKKSIELRISESLIESTLKGLNCHKFYSN